MPSARAGNEYLPPYVAHRIQTGSNCDEHTVRRQLRARATSPALDTTQHSDFGHMDRGRALCSNRLFPQVTETKCYAWARSRIRARSVFGLKSSMDYAKSRNGVIHGINSPNGGEHTLCGDAFDIDSEEGDEARAWEPVAHGPITCPECAAVVRHCNTLKVSRKI